jgi:hypothetical protein
VSETLVRVVVVAAVLATAAVALWWGRRVRWALPRPGKAKGLAPGVYFFSSAGCTPCARTRQILGDRFGSGYTEIDYETHPSEFIGKGIGKVPTVIVVETGGKVTVFEGVPRPRDLVGGGP